MRVEGKATLIRDFLSRFVDKVLRRRMSVSNEYQQAMCRYLNSDLVIHRQPHERPGRDALHDRR